MYVRLTVTRLTVTRLYVCEPKFRIEILAAFVAEQLTFPFVTVLLLHILHFQVFLVVNSVLKLFQVNALFK